MGGLVLTIRAIGVGGWVVSECPFFLILLACMDALYYSVLSWTGLDWAGLDGIWMGRSNEEMNMYM
jgi:hypothetical protein